MKLKVHKKACDTCPYLKSTPPGVWSASEYEKLREFDLDPEHGGPIATVFHCHQENATGEPTACRGWLSVHKNSIPVRMAQLKGQIDPEDVPLEKEPQYYLTGTEACLAGLSGVDRPSIEARLKIARLIDRGAGELIEEE